MCWCCSMCIGNIYCEYIPIKHYFVYFGFSVLDVCCVDVLRSMSARVYHHKYVCVCVRTHNGNMLITFSTIATGIACVSVHVRLYMSLYKCAYTRPTHTHISIGKQSPSHFCFCVCMHLFICVYRKSRVHMYIHYTSETNLSHTHMLLLLCCFSTGRFMHNSTKPNQTHSSILPFFGYSFATRLIEYI